MNLGFCFALCDCRQQKLTLATIKNRIFIVVLLYVWVCMCLYVCLGVVVVLGWESHGVNQKLESQAREHPGVMGTLERSATGSAETAFTGNSQSGQYQDSTPLLLKKYFQQSHILASLKSQSPKQCPVDQT